MRYMLLISNDEAIDERRTEAESEKLMADYWAFSEEVKGKGTGDALHPTTTATTVRVRDGQTMITDGPFAETKEQLGGFYLLDCEDLDEALALAAKIPTATYGSIEVRPVFEFE